MGGCAAGDAFSWLREGRWMHARRNASAIINRSCPSRRPLSFHTTQLFYNPSFAVALHPRACNCDGSLISWMGNGRIAWATATMRRATASDWRSARSVGSDSQRRAAERHWSSCASLHCHEELTVQFASPCILSLVWSTGQQRSTAPLRSDPISRTGALTDPAAQLCSLLIDHSDTRHRTQQHQQRTYTHSTRNHS